MYDEFDASFEIQNDRPADPQEEQAVASLRAFFRAHPTEVFFSRQLEVQFEGDYFHWITNRAIRRLVAERTLLSEARKLNFGGETKLIWPRGYRYHRRKAAELLSLVEEYSAPNIGGALGLHGEAMVLEGFARREFVMKGRDVT